MSTETTPSVLYSLLVIGSLQPRLRRSKSLTRSSAPLTHPPIRSQSASARLELHNHLSQPLLNVLDEKYAITERDVTQNRYGAGQVTVEVPFVTGSPAVLLSKGVLQLWRRVDATNMSLDDKHDQSNFNLEGDCDSNCTGLFHTLITMRYKERLVAKVQIAFGCIVAVLAVPTWMTAADFVAFLGPQHCSQLVHVRLLRDTAPDRYMALMRFKTRHEASLFCQKYDGTPFTSMSKACCHVKMLHSVVFELNEIMLENWPPPLHLMMALEQVKYNAVVEENDANVNHSNSVSFWELPTCPVCLERLDAMVSGILTIPCQHAFHCNCLSPWTDSRCPVCRDNGVSTDPSHSSSPLSKQSQCLTCGTSGALWLCLLCGHVGCSRYHRAHAYNHYRETGHLLALEVGTRRVWHYGLDGYVHRVAEEESGKMVAIPTKLDDAFLIAQLDSQREYYEQLIYKDTREVSVATETRTTNENFTSPENWSCLSCSEKENQVKSLKQNQSHRDIQMRQLQHDLSEERVLTAALRDRLLERDVQCASLEREKLDLEEQIRDLMVHMEMLQRVQNDQGGEVVVRVPTNNTNKKQIRKKR